LITAFIGSLQGYSPPRRRQDEASIRLGVAGIEDELEEELLAQNEHQLVGQST
jgi:hypothetical protein